LQPIGLKEGETRDLHPFLSLLWVLCNVASVQELAQLQAKAAGFIGNLHSVCQCYCR
jgi:hypothetical protein